MLACRKLPDVALGGWLIAILVLLPSGLTAQQKQLDGAPEARAPIEEGQKIAEGTPAPENDAPEAPESYDQPIGEPGPPATSVQSERATELPCNTRCQEADQRDQDDLIAQQSMAQSTGELVWLTFWHIVIGAGGIGLLVWTLYYTRQATKAATRSAEAAQEAVKAAQRQADAAILLEGDIILDNPNWDSYVKGVRREPR